MQLLAVSVHVADRAHGHAAVGGGLGHGRCDLDHQTRVERLGNQVFRAESELFAHVSGSHHLALLSLRQLGNGVNGGNFHLDRDGRGAGIQCAAENVGKAQDVIDLIRVIGAACRHDGVIAHQLDVFGCYFGIRVGQRENDRLRRHFLDHVLLENATGGQAQKNIRAFNDLAQRAGRGFL